MFQIIVAILFVLLMIGTTGCSEPSPQPGAENSLQPSDVHTNFNPRNEEKHVSVVIDSLEILESGEGVPGSTSEVRLLILGADAHGTSGGVYCPTDKPFQVTIGQPVVNPCPIMLTFDEGAVEDEFYVLILAVDEDRVGAPLDFGYELGIGLLAQAFVRGVASVVGESAAAVGGVAFLPELAIGAVVGYAGSKAIDWFENQDVIGQQHLILRRSQNWMVDNDISFTSHEGGMRIEMHVSRTIAPETVRTAGAVIDQSKGGDSASQTTITVHEFEETVVQPTTETQEPPTAVPKVVQQSVGRSVLGQSIVATSIGDGPRAVVVIGGLHAGFAPGTVDVVEQAATYYVDRPDEVPDEVTLYFVANGNPDATYAPGEWEGRVNANGVDLNRNWDCRWVEDAKWRNIAFQGSGGPRPFSEPETQSLKSFLEDVGADAVIFYEAKARGGLVSPGVCSGTPKVSTDLARTYGRGSGYEVADFEDLTNQELNGDGTNWLDQAGIPAIAILLPEYTEADLQANLNGLRAVLSAYGN